MRSNYDLDGFPYPESEKTIGDFTSRPITGSMHWFGRSFNAPAWDHAESTPVPVGLECLFCETPIQARDTGITLPHIGDHGGPMIRPAHIECYMRSALGPVEHLEHHCVCYDSDADCADPNPLTWREQGVLVMEWISARNPSFNLWQERA